jgi:hypothetical protein
MFQAPRKCKPNVSKLPTRVAQRGFYYGNVEIHASSFFAEIFDSQRTKNAVAAWKSQLLFKHVTPVPLLRIIYATKRKVMTLCRQNKKLYIGCAVVCAQQQLV